MRFFYTQQQMITKVILTHLFNNNTFDQLNTLYHVHDFANNLLTSLPEYFPMITNICIVEDTTEIREALKNRINATERFYCHTTYEDGQSALKGLSRDPVDLVIMDIGLPYMSGIECMMRLKRQHPSMAIIMFTVFDDMDNIFNALKSGADGYVLKEERSTGVIQAIDDFLAGGAPMSMGIARKVLESFHIYGPKNKHAESLTDHQLKILQMIAHGMQNKEIADQLSITEGSVKVQISRIYQKLQVNNRVEAINKYLGNQN